MKGIGLQNYSVSGEMENYVLSSQGDELFFSPILMRAKLNEIYLEQTF